MLVMGEGSDVVHNAVKGLTLALLFDFGFGAVDDGLRLFGNALHLCGVNIGRRVQHVENGCVQGVTVVLHDDLDVLRHAVVVGVG